MAVICLIIRLFFHEQDAYKNFCPTSGKECKKTCGSESCSKSVTVPSKDLVISALDAKWFRPVSIQVSIQASKMIFVFSYKQNFQVKNNMANPDHIFDYKVELALHSQLGEKSTRWNQSEG